MSDAGVGSRAGSTFGHYRLLRLLGAGGFGEVYEAEDTVLHRHVALKLIAAPFSQDPVFRERLFREAQHAARLYEPHVVPIHGCAEIDGQLYIDMRLIQGTDLLNLLTRCGPLEPRRAVAIVRQVASALDAAHANRVIHRDVKPENILVDPNDFACLVDFGLANAADEARLTEMGTTIGTFAYMAPERLTDGEVDHRADVYALACVLFECLTGGAPYPSTGHRALISAHLTAPIPRPSQQRPGIPAAFDEVIAGGMAKEPASRYDSAGDLALAAYEALGVDEHGDAFLTTAAAPTAKAQAAIFVSKSAVNDREAVALRRWLSGVRPGLADEMFIDLRPDDRAGGRPGAADVAVGAKGVRQPDGDLFAVAGVARLPGMPTTGSQRNGVGQTHHRRPPGRHRRTRSPDIGAAALRLAGRRPARGRRRRNPGAR